MLRLFFFLAIALAIYFLWLHIQSLKKQSTSSPTDNPKPMVQCHYCNIYTPQQDAVKGTDNHWYCCSEHAQKAEK